MPESVPPREVRLRFERPEHDGRIRSSLKFHDPSVAPLVENSESLELPLRDDALEAVVDLRLAGLSRVFDTLDGVSTDLKEFFPKVDAVLPPVLRGRLVTAQAKPAAGVVVHVLRPKDYPQESDNLSKSISWPTPSAVTDRHGSFSLKLPPSPVPRDGLVLQLRGADKETTIRVRRLEVERGNLGVLEVPAFRAVEQDIVDRLINAIPAAAEDVDENPEEFADPAPVITLGEEDCGLAFQSNTGVIDRFRYSLLVRLVEPQLGQRELALRLFRDRRVLLPNPLSLFRGDQAVFDNVVKFFGAQGEFEFQDRIAVSQPIDVDQFHEDVTTAPLEYPKAGTLGLGYVVQMRQVWIPTGLSLGDLVYSLPLAPGEEQRIVVRERVQQLQVRDSETLDLEETQRFNEITDSSSQAVFETALRETATGGSHIDSTSHAWGIGAAGGVGGLVGVLFGVGAAAGYGGSTTSTNTSSWQNNSRDFTSTAVEQFHSQLSRSAILRRQAARTGVRLARSSDQQRIATRLLANRNRCHALTVQYWEVLRHFAVTSEVDDVELVCFVPLELIPFLPSGQSVELPTSSQNLTRAALLARYRTLIQFIDVLRRRVPRRDDFQTGLRALDRFVGDPNMIVQSATGPEQDVLEVSLEVTILPSENISVAVVTRNGAVAGPVRLSVVGGEGPNLDEQQFASEQQVLDFLRNYRNGDEGVLLKANIPLSTSIARNEIIRFELTRTVRPLNVQLGPASVGTRRDTTLSTREIDRELGGPRVWDVHASLLESNETYVDAHPGPAEAVVVSNELILSATRLPPILSFADVLRIESLFQHVVRNTVAYSKAVWESLTAEERAIMLEPFTIGLPGDGISSESEEVPLLNCVANKVLGFFGNSMIMPFFIPANVAAERGTTTQDLQEALVRFHRQALRAPRTSLTLPTRGVLGEAVLGNCNSCEKIDLTRFWNWKDAPPLDAALDPKELFESQQFPEGTLVGKAGAQAPDELVPQDLSKLNLIGNITTGGEGAVTAPTSGILKQLLGATEPKFSAADVTGLSNLKTVVEDSLTKANAAREQALKQSKEFALKAMTDFSKIRSAQNAVDRAKAEKLQDRVDKLVQSKDKIAKLLGRGADDESAASKTKTELQKLFPDLSKLTLEQRAGLLEEFTAGAEDDAELQRGKTAILKFFGLGS